MIGFYNYTVVATYMATTLGILGVFQALNGNVFGAVLCLLLAGLLDTVDGAIARTKKDRTAEEKLFGVQIDSLNDMICFGLLPASASFRMAADAVEAMPVWYTAVLCVFVLSGLIRLAYFNVLEETRQASGGTGARAVYLGLPITGSTLTFPLLYLLARAFPHSTLPVIAGGLLLTAALYLTPIRLRHPNAKGIAALALVGTVELTALLIL